MPDEAGKFRLWLYGGDPENIPLEKRIFIILTFFSTLIVIAGLVLNISVGINIYASLIIFVAAVIIAWFYLQARKPQDHYRLIFPFTTVCIVLISGTWIVNAGYDGNILLLIFVTYIILNIASKKQYRRALFFIFLFFPVALILLHYYFPHFIIGYDNDLQRILDLTLGYALNITLLYLTMRSLVSNYDKQAGIIAKNARQIAESEEKYRSLVETSHELIWKCDTEGKITYVNPAWEKAVGYTAEEMLGKNTRSFILPKNHPEAEKPFALTLSGKAIAGFEAEVLVKDGSTLTLLFNAVTSLNPHGEIIGIQGTAIDITERKRSEKIVRLNSMRAQALLQLNQMTDASLNKITDFALERTVEITESKIGYLAFLNDDETVLTMHSWSKEAMKECAVENKPFIYPVENTGLWGEAIRQRKSIITNDYSADNPWKKGTPQGHVQVRRHLNVPIFDGNKIVLLAGVGNKETPYDDNDIQQITLFMNALLRLIERKRSHEKLRASEARFKSLAENIPGAAYDYFYNAVTGERSEQYMGPGLENIIGPHREFEPEGDMDRIFARMHPDDVAAVAEISARAEQNNELFDYEYRLLDNSSRYHWIRSIGRPTLISENVYHWQGVLMDITAQKDEAAEKNRLQEQLSQAQKIESVGRLAGGIAHDFNNMLSVILGNTEMAIDELSIDSPGYAELQEIRKAAQRSADLTRQLLAFARKQTIIPKSLDLNETIEGMLKMLRRLIGEDIDLVWNPASALWMTNMDPAQIDQVLVNLCINSRDAITGIGSIRIVTANVSFNKKDKNIPAGGSPGDYIRLSVIDNGCGMTPQVLSQIFEPFFTTKEIGKGTGLGLSTVYGIVKQNNGFIDVSSEVGVGTVFHLFFPRIYVDDDTIRKTEMSDTPSPGAETILLVEDEPTILKLTKTILHKLGYTVLSASTPQAAIDIALEYDDRIDLLITDVIMPEMDGHELSRSIRGVYKDIKVLFMSGYTAEVMGRSGVLDKDLVFLQKPFNTMQLADKVREALQK